MKKLKKNLIKWLGEILFMVLFLVIPCYSASAEKPGTFVIKNEQFLLNGKPFVYRAGEMHPARIPKEYWRHRLQMLKAMGMNTVGIYLFWNQIEMEPGKFTWQGQTDYAAFCRIAKEEGMWVILRPGPYACAEWDMGGHPWWLGKDAPKEVRSVDPKYFQPALRYLKEVCRVLAPFQITRGGSIILYQIENEYSKSDQEYLSELMKVATENGIEVPLVACNPPGLAPGEPGRRFKKNYRDDLFQTANFSRGQAKEAIGILKTFKIVGPYANGEFYPGWFDSWGRKHQAGNVKTVVEDIDWMLSNKISFSMYMAHGGTNFGLWASGGGPPLRPLTTSYDYDAPVSESGQTTDKFFKIQDVLSKHLEVGEVLPPVPKPINIISIPTFQFEESSSVFDTRISPIIDVIPRNMEAYDQGYGAILYRTELAPGAASEISVKGISDFAWIYLDGKKLGVMDKRISNYKVQLPEITKKSRLDIFVMAMGRPNDGSVYLKGLMAPVNRTVAGISKELRNWEVFKMPLDSTFISNLKFKSVSKKSSSFWRAQVTLSEVGDTFLEFRNLGHGVLWVNGHNLGRYWNIGPQQALYCPGAWSKLSGK